MSAYKLDIARVKAALEKLMEKYTVIAPVMNGDRLDYAEVTEVNDVILDNQLPYKSPKEMVFPRVEKVMRFLEGKVEEAQDIKPVLLVGAKPCDVAAMRIFDDIFTGDKGKFQDPFYLNRRNSLTIIGLGCTDYKNGCFCNIRGTDLSFAPDCDGFLNMVGDSFIYQPLTDKGKDIFTGEETEPVKRADKHEEELVLNAKESEVFTTMPWEAYAEGCIGCGTCTYLCPTCPCFILRDAEDKGVVTRTRVWDSCMYPKFTLHAGGHNPRTKKSERFRQRVLHKYLYIPENYDHTACTGCGRCIRACPGGLNIMNTVTDIKKRLEEAKK